LAPWIPPLQCAAGALQEQGNMRFIFAFVTSALLASAPAFAADDSGFYVGAGLGSFSLQSEAISLDLEGLEIDTGRDFDGSDFAFKVLGGWQWNKYIAFEVEYFDGGNPEDKFDFSYSDSEIDFDGQITIEADTSGWIFSALGIWPLGDSFNLFAKLGFVTWSVDGRAVIKVPDFDYQDSWSIGSEDGTDFAWGLGGTWNFTDNMGVRAEYQQFELDEFNNVNLASASFIYKF
jgi:opacity protein-like surface antigen